MLGFTPGNSRMIYVFTVQASHILEVQNLVLRSFALNTWLKIVLIM